MDPKTSTTTKLLMKNTLDPTTKRKPRKDKGTKRTESMALPTQSKADTVQIVVAPPVTAPPPPVHGLALGTCEKGDRLVWHKINGLPTEVEYVDMSQRGCYMVLEYVEGRTPRLVALAGWMLSRKGA